MMVIYSDTEDQFFVARDDVSSVSDSSFDSLEGSLSSRIGNYALGYEFWTGEPGSIDERRDRFFRWMGLTSDWQGTIKCEGEESYHEDMKREIDRLRNHREDVLANLDSESDFFSSRSSQSFRSYDDQEDGAVRIKNHVNETEFVMDELADDFSSTTLDEVGSDKMISLDEFQKTLGSSSLVQQLLSKDCKGFTIVNPKKKSSWLQRFSVMGHIIDMTKGLLRKPDIDPKTGPTPRRVPVNVYKKHSKELSSLYTGQEFHAHEGSILTMKFSPDGLYLASAGADGVVRIWKVLEDDIVNKLNTQDIDPSCLYFSLNHFSKLAPLDVAKEGVDHTKCLKKSSDSSCVILPPKAFQLSETPLHEFRGHKGEVLALSWSKNGVSNNTSNLPPTSVLNSLNIFSKNHNLELSILQLLLSSSVDKTARLWRVGQDHCLGVYSHNNYGEFTLILYI